jgi:hypothetical protein
MLPIAEIIAFLTLLSGRFAPIWPRNHYRERKVNRKKPSERNLELLGWANSVGAELQDQGDRWPLGPGIHPSIARTTTPPFPGGVIKKVFQIAYPAKSITNDPFRISKAPRSVMSRFPSLSDFQSAKISDVPFSLSPFSLSFSLCPWC